MSEGADPPRRAVPAPEEMPWSISYLRDDIKELRTEVGAQVGALHNRIDETRRSLSDRIDQTNKRMDTHFLWTMGTLVTLTGVLIAVIKL